MKRVVGVKDKQMSPELKKLKKFNPAYKAMKTT